MPDKVMISFLGTNNYIRCNYFFKDTDRKIEKVRFVQEAIIPKCCSEWTENDRIFIFLTKSAECKNWNDGGHIDLKTGKVIEEDDSKMPVKGLDAQLKALNLCATVTPVKDVPEGNSEEEILKIFSIIEEHVELEDELWLDITHGFRSLPMLAMVLLQFLKTVKNTTVGKIYYGAFEGLGNAGEIKKMPLEKRNVPVLDLTAFHTIQTWAAGADIFKNFGDAGRIKETINQYSRPLIAESRGKDLTSKKDEFTCKTT